MPSIIEGYAWASSIEWYDPHEPDPSEITLAESAVLFWWNPNKAIPLLRNILDYTNYSETPRRMYLLGLAYELVDDKVNAVQTYWMLWHNYPGSPYSRLTQAKLELQK